MVPRALASALLLPALLHGQTAVLRVLMHQDTLGDAAPATLVVLEPRAQASLAGGFQHLLQQDDLEPLQVPLRVLSLDSPEGARLAGRLHLDSRIRWLLLATGDVVLARGADLPTAARLAGDLAAAGFRDRTAELRAFLQAHPESLEARERLIGRLRARAEAVAQRLMGLEVATPMTPLDQGDLAGFLQTLDAPAQADLHPARELTPTQDLQAWGAFAQALDEAFRDGSWRELDLAFSRDGRPLDAASPTLRLLYRRLQPEVEAALRQEPSSGPLWDLWVWMAQGRQEADPRPFLASLDPPPLAPPGTWPPERAVRMLLATARTPDQWRSLQTYFLDRWEGAPRQLLDPPPAGPTLPGQASTTNALLEREWSSILGPLVEASLRCGDANRADALVRRAWEASRWPPLPAKAAAVARRCARTDLSARWAALRPGAGP